MKKIKIRLFAAIFLAVFIVLPNLASAKTWCHTFNTNLKIGDRGDEATALRTALTKDGFSNVSTELGSNDTAGFDKSLASAVSAFQEKYKDEILTPNGLQNGTGFVGKSTRAKLNKLYGCVIIETPISNQPPVISGVSGPTSLKVNEIGTWTVKASDPEQRILSYSVRWGDENITGLYSAAQRSWVYAQTAEFTHSYAKAGVYSPTFTVTDDKGFPAKTSISVNVGEIIAPFITVLSPNGGEAWQIGSTYEIKWKSENVKDNVMILINRNSYLNTKPYAFITRNTSNTGSYLWDTSKPLDTQSGSISNLENGQDYVILIQNIGTGVSDKSDAAFSIAAATPSIAVTYPNGGEQWITGRTFTIQIKSTCIKESVVLYLYSNNGANYVQSIGQAVADGYGNANYSWMIPSNIPADNTYKILAALVSMPKDIFDYSDTSFSIVAGMTPSITVLLPNGGEQWVTGGTYTIQIKSIYSRQSIALYLYNNGGANYVQSIGQAVADGYGNASYSWMIPSNILADTTYKILAALASTPKEVSDYSDTSFSIVAAETSTTGLLQSLSQKASILESILESIWQFFKNIF
jgi:hypothetical protein